MLDNPEKLAKSLKYALNQEIPRVGEVRTKLTGIPAHYIVEPQKTETVIATVATDGGENKLILDPIRIQIIRVVDSRGKTHFEDFIPLSLDETQIFQLYFKSNDELQWLKQQLDLEWDDLFPATEYLKANLMGMLRELLEWTAILRLMTEDSKPHIVLRDGLLRSVTVPGKVFAALRNAFDESAKRRSHQLVGVAKRSRVLSYLSLVISLEDALPLNRAGYIEISVDMEKEATPPNYRWTSPRSMGKLVLARLVSGADAIFPVEIPDWNYDERENILSNLSLNATNSFPDPGYPFSLVEAHRLANIGGFQIEILERMLIDLLNERDPNLATHVLKQMLLGKRLSMPISGEEEDE